MTTATLPIVTVPQPVLHLESARTKLRTVAFYIEQCFIQRGQPEPDAIRAMWPVVWDALCSGDVEWVTRVYGYFKIVVQGCLLHEHVWIIDLLAWMDGRI